MFLDADQDRFQGLNSSSARSTPIPFTPSADTSILPIVTSQRDRFRQRNAELEEVSQPYVPIFHVLAAFLPLACLYSVWSTHVKMSAFDSI
jgi:hypothetical protein